MPDPLRVLSLGAGVQSSALFLMSCRGDLPRLDAAVFADTGWEPSGVYRTMEFLESRGEEYGIPVHRVGIGRSIRDDALVSQIRGRKGENGERWASMPLFVLGPDGSRGMIRRQCTGEYKIRPIERFVRHKLLGLAGRQRAKPGSVDQWFGISSDESQRMKESSVLWKRHVYPLCNFPDDVFPKLMTRRSCEEYLLREWGQHEFVRSACIGCPFRSPVEWQEIRRNKAEWDDAVYVDAQIRDSGGMRGQVFLHSQRVPLSEVNFDDDQGDLWGNECEGACGT